MRLAWFLLVLLSVAPLVPSARAAEGVDAVVDVAPDGTASASGAAAGALAFEGMGRENLTWRLRLTSNYTTFEFRLHGVFDVARDRQVVPLLHEPSTEYPLFERFPGEDVWNADGPARVYAFAAGSTADEVVLRLGIPGPANATLVLQRDVTPPVVTPGPMQNLTARSFFQETTTDELALVDLQVREVGAETWVQNPTTVFHVLQRFPVQGLDPEREYETRFVAEDWAGNPWTGTPTRLRTPPLPEAPRPVVTILEPAPNATLAPGDVLVRARIESPDSPVTSDGLRLFVDKKEVVDGYTVVDGVLSYTLASAAEGRHSVAVEVTNEAGGFRDARWGFDVKADGTPLGLLVPLLAAGVAALLPKARGRP